MALQQFLIGTIKIVKIKKSENDAKWQSDI